MKVFTFYELAKSLALPRLFSLRISSFILLWHHGHCGVSDVRCDSLLLSSDHLPFYTIFSLFFACDSWENFYGSLLNPTTLVTLKHLAMNAKFCTLCATLNRYHHSVFFFLSQSIQFHPDLILTPWR